MTERRGVIVYDLSRSAGWALYAPGREAPRHGILQLPPTGTDGSNGAMFKLLFDHIAWADRLCGGLACIGYEAFIAPTGGKKDQEKSFVTSPKTLKIQIGTIAIAEMCAAMLGIQSKSIHNASWRSYWLGSQKRGTDRATWKKLAIAKAERMGWQPKGDDDADALGQLHWLLRELKIDPEWQTTIDRDLVTMALRKGRRR